MTRSTSSRGNSTGWKWRTTRRNEPGRRQFSATAPGTAPSHEYPRLINPLMLVQIVRERAGADAHEPRRFILGRGDLERHANRFAFDPFDVLADVQRRHSRGPKAR